MTNEMTANGLEKLKNQLLQVQAQLRDVAQRIKEAKDLGDLSENAEYLGAKEEQAFLLGRASMLEERIRSAKVAKKNRGGMVAVGCKVIVLNGKNESSFEIVGPEEADPLNGRISPDSPIGGALYGRKKGEVVSVSTPRGMTEYKILDIA